MKHIFYCEWLRYKKLTIICAIVYIALLFVLNTKSPLYTMSELAFILLIIVPSLFSITLAVNQFLLHKKASHWTYLIHKPLPMWQIYIGLISSFLAMLFIVVLAPIAAYIVILDVQQPILIEPRHFLLLPYIALTAMSFYFAGIFVTLHPRKLAAVVVLVPFYVLAAEVKGLEQFIPIILVTLLLFLLSWSAFKVDLLSNLRQPLSSMLCNITTQYSLFVLLSIIVFEVGHIGISLRTVDLSPKDEVNYYANSISMDDKQRMLWNIYGIDEQQYESLENELSLSTFSYLRFNDNQTLPEMHQSQPIMDDRGTRFFDTTNKVRWRFSHQYMLYSGFDRNDDFVGWLGKNGRDDSIETAGKFDHVPFVKNGYLYLPDSLLQYNESEQVFDTYLSLQEGQRFEYSPFVGSNFVAVILTNEIQMFLKNQFARDAGIAEPTSIIPLNHPVSDIKNITFAELFDGHLISISYGTTQFNAFDKGAADIKDGFVLTYKAPYEVEVKQLAQRSFKQGWPDWMVYRDFVISSVFAYAKYYFGEGNIVQLPKTQLIASLMMMFIIALLTTLLMRNSTKSAIEKVSWVVSSALFGIPGLITCWFFSDWRPDRPTKN